MAPRFRKPDHTDQDLPPEEPWLRLRPRADFVRTGSIAALAERAGRYLDTGLPVHFRGPAGSGKTTLALHLAERIGRPVVLIVGDATFDTSRLVGQEGRHRTRRVIDRYISSVTKVESETSAVWVDRALSIACAEGATLIYDEFNRAPPAANNVLLTVLEEKLLILPAIGGGESYRRVHPDFRLLLTSNPTDHVGTHDAQNALMDRVVTLDLEDHDRETELAIIAARSGIEATAAARIVDLVRAVRQAGAFSQRPSMRAALMIAQVAAREGLAADAAEPRFRQLCADILASRLRPAAEGQPDPRQALAAMIDRACTLEAAA